VKRPQIRDSFLRLSSGGVLCSGCLAVFVLVFGIQARKSYGVPEKADRFPLFVLMGVGSVMGLAFMILLKPKKKKVAE